MISPREHLELRRAATRFLATIQALPGWREAFSALPGTPEGAAEMSFSQLQWTITGRRTSELTQEAADIEELRAYEKGLAGFAKRYLCGTVWGAHALHDARRLHRRILLPEGNDRWVQLGEDFDAELCFKAGQPYPASYVLQAVDGLRSVADALEAAMNFSAQDRHDREKAELLDDMQRSLPKPAPHQRPDKALTAVREWRKQQADDATLPTDCEARLRAATEVIAARLGAETSVSPAAQRKRIQRARELLNVAVTARHPEAAPLDPADLRGGFFGPYLDQMRGLADGDRARRRSG